MGYYADRMPGIFVVISYAAALYCDREWIPKSRADINVCYQNLCQAFQNPKAFQAFQKNLSGLPTAPEKCGLGKLALVAMNAARI